MSLLSYLSIFEFLEDAIQVIIKTESHESEWSLRVEDALGTTASQMISEWLLTMVQHAARSCESRRLI